MPEADPVTGVSYHSDGRLLIIGGAAPALAWARELAETLEVSVLLTSGGAAEATGATSSGIDTCSPSTVVAVDGSATSTSTRGRISQRRNA